LAITNFYWLQPLPATVWHLYSLSQRVAGNFNFDQSPMTQSHGIHIISLITWMTPIRTLKILEYQS